MKANTKLIALTTTSAVRTPGLLSARVSGGAGVAALVSSTSQRTGFTTHSAAAVASTGIKNAMGRMGAETIKPPSAGPTTKDPTSTVTSNSVARMLCTRAMVGKAAAVAGKAGVAVATASEAQITATNGEPAATEMLIDAKRANRNHKVTRMTRSLRAKSPIRPANQENNT